MPAKSAKRDRRSRYSEEKGRPQASGKKRTNAIVKFMNLRDEREELIRKFEIEMANSFDGFVSCDAKFETDKQMISGNPHRLRLSNQASQKTTVYYYGTQQNNYTSESMKTLLDNNNDLPTVITLLNDLCLQATIFRGELDINMTDPFYKKASLECIKRKSHAIFKAYTNGSDGVSIEKNEIRFHGDVSYELKAASLANTVRHISISFGPVVDLIHYKHTDIHKNDQGRNISTEILLFPANHGSSISMEIVPPIIEPPIKKKLNFEFPAKEMWIENAAYAESIQAALTRTPKSEHIPLKSGQQELRAFQFPNHPHITASYLFKHFPNRRMIAVEQTTDTHFNSGLASKHIQRAIADMAKLQVVRLVLANVAVILYQKSVFGDRSNIDHAGALDTTTIINKCDEEADQICNKLNLATHMHRFLVSTVILSDYLGELYDSVYNNYIFIHKPKHPEETEAETEEAKTMAEEAQAMVTKEMIEQIRHIDSNFDYSITGNYPPFIFGDRLLIRCMLDQKIAVFPKSEATYPRAARNPAAPQDNKTPVIDGKTVLVAVRGIQTDTLSKSNEGHQWNVTTLYDIRSRFFLPLKDLIMKNYKFTHFNWLSDYSFFGSAKNAKPGLFPPEQNYSVSISPNITTKLNTTINLPFIIHKEPHAIEESRLKNTLPAIAQH